MSLGSKDPNHEYPTTPEYVLYVGAEKNVKLDNNM